MRCRFAVPLLLAAAAPDASAQEAAAADTAHFGGGRVVRVDTLEVTALGGPAARAAGAVHVVEVAPGEGARALGSGELLRRAPGVHFQDEDGLGLHVNVGVRGLDPRRSSRVLLLEDGVPVHLAPYGDPTAHYQPPPDAVARVEVLKGSGQVLHGPQTVGGVVNYVRRAPAPGAAVSLAGGTGGALLGRVSLGASRGGRSADLSLGRRATDGPRDGWRHTVHDVLVRGALRSGAHAFAVQGGAYDERSDWGEAGLTQAEFEAAPFANPSPSDFFALRRYAGRALHEVALGGGARLRTSAYAQHVHRASWRQASSSSDRFGTEDFAEDFACPPGALGLAECGNQGRPRTYAFAGVEPRLHLPHRLLGVPAVSDLGVRLHGELAVRRQYTGATADARAGERTRDNALRSDAVAAFAQSRLHLGAWTVTPGARLEHVRSRNENRMQGLRLSDRYTRLLPGLGAAWEPSPRATLFAGVHRGFAPPRPADVLSPRPGEGLVQVRPETSWNHELGVRAAPHPLLAVDATLFRIDFQDQIVEGSLAGAGQRFVNAGETVHEGVELGVDAGASPLFVEAAYTWVARAAFRGELRSSVDGETPVRGNRLPYAPRHLLRAAVGHRAPAGAELRLVATHVSRQFGDDLNTVEPSADGQRGVLPAYTVLDVSGTVPVGRGAAVWIAVRNAGDALYITGRQEGIMVGMPRSVLVGARWGM